MLQHFIFGLDMLDLECRLQNTNGNRAGQAICLVAVAGLLLKLMDVVVVVKVTDDGLKYGIRYEISRT